MTFQTSPALPFVSSPAAEGAKTGVNPVIKLLRTEGLAVLAAAAIAYARLDGDWILFAALFLAPDLFMLGYLAGRRVGAVCYNIAHTYLTPAALAAVGLLLQQDTLLALALIWTAHIGADRALGYGLKDASGFGMTHLGFKGKTGA